MNKNKIYEYLKLNNIWHEITEHVAVYNMSEASNIALPYPQCGTKNLFVRDDKKKNYYLITVKGDKKVDLKEFRRKMSIRPLSFASEEDLGAFLKLTPGSVTPLGVLNDHENKVQVFLDKEFMKDEKIIGVHPNENTATVWMNTEDLINIIIGHGNIINVVEI